MARSGNRLEGFCEEWWVKLNSQVCKSVEYQGSYSRTLNTWRKKIVQTAENATSKQSFIDFNSLFAHRGPHLSITGTDSYRVHAAELTYLRKRL